MTKPALDPMTSWGGWSPADVAAVDDLLDALNQERAIINNMWFVTPDKEWRLPKLQAKRPSSPKKTSKRKCRPQSAIDKRDFFIPTRWTRAQAALVHSLLCDIGTQISLYYLALPDNTRAAPALGKPAASPCDNDLLL